MRWMTLALTLVSAACGGDNDAPIVSAPTPTPAPAPVFRGTVTETLNGAPVLGWSVETNGNRVTVSAPGYLSRETSIIESNVDLIRETAPFELDFYRRLVRNAHESPDSMQPLRRQARAPRVYVKTVDEAGQPIDGRMLDGVISAVIDSAEQWTGGHFGLASIESGAQPPTETPGVIVVKWPNPATEGNCGRATVGGSWIELNYLGSRCACRDGRFAPRTVRHELGHAMGFWHTGSPDDVMSGVTWRDCDQRPNDRERYHAAVAYSRPIGSMDVDVDPAGFRPQSMRSAPIVID